MHMSPHGPGPGGPGRGGPPPSAARLSETATREDIQHRPPIRRVLTKLWPFIRPYIGAIVFGTLCVALSEVLMIQKALARLMEGRTCFVIAHRLSTIRTADKIAAIEGGHIAEVGDHATLLEKNGTYAHMYQTQFRLTLEEESEQKAEATRFRTPEVREPALNLAGADF